MEQTTNMEKITTTQMPRKSEVMWKALKLLLCGALTFSSISCGKTTQKDVANQEKKIESISFQISHYINARKWLVANYNNLLKYPKTESNKADINRSLAQIYEKITEYDEKLQDLAEDKLEAIDDLNGYISDLEVSFSPNQPIDPNRWDFLLTLK